MVTPSMENLSINDEYDLEGFCFDVEEDGDEVSDLKWCLVGRFLCDRFIHVQAMKNKVADVWSPMRGVKEAKYGLFLFQFSHKLDMDAMLQGRQWTFDSHLLIIEKVRIEMQIENIPLYHVDFWIQIHNLPAGMMMEKVGKTLANFIGAFVEYDKNNNTSYWREYMRIRVKIDVRQPLKRQRRIKNKGGFWCVVKFKYEKLSLFFFVCGKLGHSENKCEIRFAMVEDNDIRESSNDLRLIPDVMAVVPLLGGLKPMQTVA
ncbi:uncharacterized protein At4g02000-like [Vicia villosa]|uniref:uncharacterized protein At4g02000-like n=1 Tax=Vicia villosa TaxID=3911 RepID=UPI00273CB868|nr:uncharacterized protein At4g02000-like [Vicia villosa]